MKTIKLRKDGKTVYQFIVYDSQLSLAEKLGIDESQYIIELAKVELEKRHTKNYEESE